MAAAPDGPEDEGFLVLLKPIQDMTRNWDVDLSLHLEEYMNHIRQICGDNPTDMNFAQAAVLLQNSANIYSKKVDFLFSTVLKLLETLCKKQSDKKQKDGQEDEAGAGEGQPAARRRRAAVSFDTEEFVSFEDVCADRCLTLNLEKERQKIAEVKKQKIVLNAATKVRAKEMTSCTVYNFKKDNMGKKEEFRLTWRICSAGTLHEEFIIKKSVFQKMNPLDITVLNAETAPVDNSCHDYDDDGPPPEPDLSPPSDDIPDLGTSVLDLVPPDRESELMPHAQQKARKEALHTVDGVREMIEREWQANDFNMNLTDKPIKKRKVIKIPPSLDNDKKRKHLMNMITSYTITEVLLKPYNNNSFLRDPDFSYHSHMAARHKRLLMLNHRAKYQAYMEREAALEQVDDFHGFYNEDQDSDNEPDFGGFEDNAEPPPEVPLPGGDNILTGERTEQVWGADNQNAYKNEAMRTMQAFRERKIDHDRMTDMARRVEEWHQKITPKLEAAEERSSFDIHGYGTKIIDTFRGEIGSQKQFEEIVAGQSKEEVARYFLASLVLANQYNIEISESQPGDLNTDCMQLRLLSLTRHHDEMDDNIRQTSNK